MKLQHIIPILLLALLASCASRRAVKPVPEPVAPVVEEPTWHTCSANARAAVTLGKQQAQATLQLQAVRDSMMIVSIQLLPGLEMARVEATPDLVTLIDKMNKQYRQMDYNEMSVWAKRPVSWDMLQHLLEANEQDKIELTTDLAGQTVSVQVSQIKTSWDVPVRLRAASTAGYKIMMLPEPK